MAPADHLIERAAALLQGGAKPAGLGGPAADDGLDAALPRAVPLPVADAAPGTAAFARHAYVPSPPDRPILVQPGPLQPSPSQPNSLQPNSVQQGPHRPVELPASHAAAPAALTLPSTGLSDTGLLDLDRPGDRPAPPVSAPEPIGYDLLQAAGMIVARGGRSRISEEYRIVLGRVLRAQRDEPQGAGIANLLLITSAKPGEGKSFTSLNLAGSIAQHTTEKVLLVDLDAKLRPMTALLGASEGLGFYDLVADPLLPLQSLIRPTAITGLSFLPVGHRPADLGSGSGNPITTTITRLARQFPQHIVILDAAPCLSTSDPSTVAPIVGQVVMVIEAERTQRSEVEAALELIRVCPTITMLLNKVRLTTSHTFGAYDYYGNYS